MSMRHSQLLHGKGSHSWRARQAGTHPGGSHRHSSKLGSGCLRSPGPLAPHARGWCFCVRRTRASALTSDLMTNAPRPPSARASDASRKPAGGQAWPFER